MLNKSKLCKALNPSNHNHNGDNNAIVDRLLRQNELLVEREQESRRLGELQQKEYLEAKMKNAESKFVASNLKSQLLREFADLAGPINEQIAEFELYMDSLFEENLNYLGSLGDSFSYSGAIISRNNSSFKSTVLEIASQKSLGTIDEDKSEEEVVTTSSIAKDVLLSTNVTTRRRKIADYDKENQKSFDSINLDSFSQSTKTKPAEPVVELCPTINESSDKKRSTLEEKDPNDNGAQISPQKQVPTYSEIHITRRIFTQIRTAKRGKLRKGKQCKLRGNESNNDVGENGNVSRRPMRKCKKTDYANFFKS